MPIRLNVAAAIVRNEQILLVEFNDETGLHYNLPGGGVHEGESIYDALRREVLEECQAELEEIKPLLMIWEYIGVKQNHQYGEGHKVALVFPCTLQAGSEPYFPPNPDLHQTGVRWVALDNLHTLALIPNITEQLVSLLRDHSIHPIQITDQL